MLQRVQSLFLLLAFNAMIASMFFPFWVFVNKEKVYELNIFSVSLFQSTSLLIQISCVLLFVLVCLSGILSIISFFRFKKRTLQLKMNNINLTYGDVKEN